MTHTLAWLSRHTPPRKLYRLLPQTRVVVLSTRWLVLPEVFRRLSVVAGGTAPDCVCYVLPVAWEPSFLQIMQQRYPQTVTVRLWAAPDGSQEYERVWWHEALGLVAGERTYGYKWLSELREVRGV